MDSFLLLVVGKDATFATTGCNSQYLGLRCSLRHIHKPNLNSSGRNLAATTNTFGATAMTLATAATTLVAATMMAGRLFDSKPARQKGS